MVAQKQPQTPEQKSSRERRIQHLQERRRIKKITRKLRTVTVDNDTVTEAANFQFMEIFKQLIDIEGIISEHFTLEQKNNCVYTHSQLIDYLLDCSILGHTRFLHMDALQSDPGYQIVKEIDRFPDESTFRTFLKKLNWNHLIQLIAINK